MQGRSLAIGLAFLAIAFVAITVWSLRYFGRYQPFADLMRDNTRGNLDRIGLQVNDAVLVGRSNGRRHWRVAARSITFSRDRTSVEVENIHDGVLYDAKERAIVKVSAGHATYSGVNTFSNSEVAGSLNLDRGIRAVLLTRGGTSLQTDRLLWAAAWNEVRCPGRVTVTFPKGSGTVQGENIVYDVKTSNLSLHHLHGTFRVSNLVQ